MLKSYKTEINPTPEQVQIIHRTIGTCRFVYNFYLAHNQEIYQKEKRFVSGMDFSKWLNNEYIPKNPEYQWIKEVSSKSVKKSIMNAETAFKRFFKHQSRFPRFKKKGKSDVKMYFVKTDKRVVIQCERHRIKMPTLGWVRLKEKGYLPTSKSGCLIKSGHVSMRAGRYYVSVLVDIPDISHEELNEFGIGIDLGVKDFAVISNGKVYKSINKSSNIEDLNVSGMMKNRHLSKAIVSQKFYEFRTKLEAKCKEYGIELRVVDRWYPSSKLCHECGQIKSDLKLSDREYICDCGYHMDRDLNAALNLRDALIYKVA